MPVAARPIDQAHGPLQAGQGRGKSTACQAGWPDSNRACPPVVYTGDVCQGQRHAEEVQAIVIYELLNKDVPVLAFAYDEATHHVVDVARVLEPSFAPPSIVGLDGTISTADVSWWWQHRSIPASRNQIDRLKRSLGIEDASELLERNFALSLSDRYWVRPEGSNLTWTNVNFFDNDFSDELGRLTLEPSLSPTVAQLDDDDLMSPNSSVMGDVPKKWIIGKGGIRWLVKAGTHLFDQDVFNEIVASALYRRLLAPIDYVAYRLLEHDGAAYCTCPNMLGPDEELVTAADLLRRHRHEERYGTYGSVLKALGTTGLDEALLKRGLSQVFSCDFLLANADRHTGNFGVIRDCVTLRYKRFAPTWDAGFSLWCDRRRLEHPFDYAYSPRPFTGHPAESPEQQLRLFDDYTWLPASFPAELSAWRDEALEILASNPLMPTGRIEAIASGIDLNVREFERHVERMAQLFPRQEDGER